MPPPRLPDRGSPAYTALADQFDAAQRDATRQAAALLAAGAVLVLPTGPWAAALFASVSAGQPYREVCPTLAADRGARPVWVVEPRVLICSVCLVDANPPTEPCARCRRARRPLLPHRLHIAQQRHVIAHGRLCLICSSGEHHRTEGVLR